MVTLEAIGRECCDRSSEMPLERFDQGCRAVADRLDRPHSLDDEGLRDHYAALISAGDRLAAVHLLIPSGWSYSIARDFDGHVMAQVTTSPQEKTWRAENHDEGIALLGALALALSNRVRSAKVIQLPR